MYEFNSTQTQYQSSYAIKVIWAKLINTILILILVNRFLKKPVYFYSTSGLSQDVYYLSLTLSFLNPLLVIFDPWYFFIKYLRVWYYDRPGIFIIITQRKSFSLNKNNLTEFMSQSFMRPDRNIFTSSPCICGLVFSCLFNQLSYCSVFSGLS